MKKIKYLSLPFINDKSETIARKIQETVRSHFSNINLRVAFKSPATLSNHFPFKDIVTDPSKLSMVVYHLKCKNCDADYIGQSKRICNIRMDEHQKPTKNKKLGGGLSAIDGCLFLPSFFLSLFLFAKK